MMKQWQHWTLSWASIMASVVLTAGAYAAESGEKQSLVDLARGRFGGKLSPAEIHFLEATQKGDIASLENPQDVDDLTKIDWSARTVSARCIEWVCFDAQARAFVTSRGLRLSGIRVDGPLDLEHSRIDFPLLAWKCVFTGEVNLKRAHTGPIYLMRSALPVFTAQEATIDGPLYLCYGLRAERELDISGATIEGDLNCQGLIVGNPNIPAGSGPRTGTINATDVTIRGSAGFLTQDAQDASHTFRANGTIRLGGASIGRNLDCRQAQLVATKKPVNRCGESSLNYALFADGASIGGAVILQGVKAEGEISLRATTIGTVVDAGAGQFEAEAKVKPWRALNLNKAKIGSSVYLTGSTLQGMLDVTEATIDGSLECKSTTINKLGEGKALDAEGAQIRRDVQLKDTFRPTGEVSFHRAVIENALIVDYEAPDSELNLTLAKVRVLDNHKESKHWPHIVHLDGFVYENFGRIPHSCQERLLWIRHHQDPRFISQPYEQTASVFKTMGLSEDARDILIARSAERAATLPPDLRSGEWWWYNFFGKFIAYGYKPYLALYWSLGFIIVGYLIFRLAYRLRMFRHTEGELAARQQTCCDAEEAARTELQDAERKVARAEITQKEAAEREARGETGARQQREAAETSLRDARREADDAKTALAAASHRYDAMKVDPRFNAFVYSVEAFVPILKLFLVEKWQVSAFQGERHWYLLGLRTGAAFRFYFWIHIVGGWVLTSLWVAGLSGLVKG